MASDKPDNKENEIHAAGKLKWWQLSILYPTLVTSILAAIPTFVELYRSNKYGVGFGQSAQAMERERLFIKNMTCAAEPLQWVKAKNSVEIDATICVSGDVLVRLHSPFNVYAYDFVSVDRLLTDAPGSVKSAASSNERVGGWLISAAYASDSVHGVSVFSHKSAYDFTPGRLICQFSPQPGIMIFRYQSVSGCYQDVVNTYTGQVLSRNGAPCGC